MKKRTVYKTLYSRVSGKRKFIQVLLGPRQVGKTTLARQISSELKKPYHYISADLATLQDLTWIKTQWEVARSKVGKNGALLIIDEAQKIPKWSEMIKALWDEDSNKLVDLHVIILGSSPWLMQKGLTESLAGRFEIIHMPHWSYTEMKEIFNWSIDKFLYYGGYPGAVATIDQKEPSRWTNYINDSLIETTISRDILLMTQVNKPVLLRRLFQFGCLYSGQILSYTKMLGELHDAGNTTTLAHYLDLLSGAGLITDVQKFSMQKIRQRASSPKLMVLNTALMNAQSTKSFTEAREDHTYWGRVVESAVGAHLINSSKGTQIEVFYWRDNNLEIDFVLKKGSKTIAIEVKSSEFSKRPSAFEIFDKKFNPYKLLVVGASGIPLEQFLSTSIENWFN